jgi:hypothetical protein
MSVRTQAELLDQYGRVTAAWVSELRSIIPGLQEWWRDLQARLAGGEVDLASIHWPAGWISHPRIIAVYRKYFFELYAINGDAIEFIHAEGQEDQPELWGSKAEQAGRGPESPSTVPPNVLLLDGLADYAPDLREHFASFVYRPIGEDPDLELC